MATACAAPLRLTAAALALGVGLAARPGACRAETLADAIALAYAHNPSLQGQRAALRASNEAYVQTRAGLGPRADFTANGTYQEGRGTYYRSGQQQQEQDPLVGHQEGRSGAINLSVTQTLYTGGRTRAALNAAEADILTQRENLRQVEISVVQQVISAYTAVRRDMQVLAAYRDNQAALERQLDQTQAEFGVRQVTRTDLDITLGRVAAARTNVANSQAQLEISRAQYLAVVGDNPGELAPEPVLDDLPPTIDAAFDAAEAHSTQILGAQFAEQSAGFRVAEARRLYAPSLQAQITDSQGPVVPYAPQGLGNQQVFTATVSLSQPLYTSGLYASQIRQALDQQNQARSQVETNRRTAIQNTSIAWSQLVAARSSLAADNAGVAATTAAFYGVRREQPFGLRLPIDVLNAEQELNAAQIRLLQDRYNEYAARTSLLASTGLLEAALLVPNLDVINPATEFRRVRNKGAVPWEPLVRAVDGIGVPRLHDPAPAHRDDAGDRSHQDQPLPPAPPPASELKPFLSATQIIAAEKAGGPPPGAPDSARPLARCNLREAQLGACAAGGPPPPAEGDAPIATSPAPPAG